MTSTLRSTGAESVAEVAERLEGATPTEILTWAFDEYGSSAVLGTGFGVEGAALLDMTLKVDPHATVFFIDTGFLFPETYELRTRIERQYGIEIRAVEPALTPQQQEDVFGANLWKLDPDFCCSMRKVEPLDEFLGDYEAWITAVRRTQTNHRATTRVVEWDDARRLVKVNPLVAWSREDVWRYVITNDIPYNPLHDRGYPSIGCTHCTRAVRPGEDERAGRWSGTAKTECGLHLRAVKA